MNALWSKFEKVYVYIVKMHISYVSSIPIFLSIVWSKERWFQWSYINNLLMITINHIFIISKHAGNTQDQN